jgi:hypothetical protein
MWRLSGVIDKNKKVYNERTGLVLGLNLQKGEAGTIYGCYYCRRRTKKIPPVLAAGFFKLTFVI